MAARLWIAALAACLAGWPASAQAPPPARPKAAKAVDDPLRHPGVFSFGPTKQSSRGAAVPATDTDIVVTNRSAPRIEDVPFAATGANRTGQDFAAPGADTHDIYNGTRSGGTYGCRAGSICSATGGGGGGSLRDLFGD